MLVQSCLSRCLSLDVFSVAHSMMLTVMNKPDVLLMPIPDADSVAFTDVDTVALPGCLTDALRVLIPDVVLL